MKDIADLLEADQREILSSIAAWAADPQGSEASGRFIAIIDSITVHARFVDIAVAAFFGSTGIAETAIARQVTYAHRSLMFLLDRLRSAVGGEDIWAMHLGILTKVVCPHLALHDQLLLAVLHPGIPVIHRINLGQAFLNVKNEIRRPARRAHGPRQATATFIDPSPAPCPRRPGQYPLHHPALAIPWRWSPAPMRSTSRRGLDSSHR